MGKPIATLAGGIALLVLAAAGPALADGASYAGDRAKIEDLQARYLFALHFRDPEAYAATFAPDGIPDHGVGEVKGRGRIPALGANLPRRAGAGRAAA